MKKRIVILGATGSIGKSALDIMRHFPQYFELVGFSYHSNEALASSIKNDFPSACTLCTKDDKNLSGLLPQNAKIIKDRIAFFTHFFEESNPDIVLNGIAGASGLIPSYVALNLGCNLALANKESIVMAYHILENLRHKNGAKIIPVDSEHWAIFQLLNMRGKEDIEKIIITASGGAFRDVEAEKLKDVNIQESFNHPTWKMGKKITIDSATLANKALEVIEATKLFNCDAKDIIVTIHKESIVHSLVQTIGGTIYAELSPPDMRTPILGALMFPKSIPEYLKPLDFTDSFSLTFSKPRYKDFPMLGMGFEVASDKKSYPIAFNASNEIAVNAFMNGEISFLDISKVVHSVLQKDWSSHTSTIEEVLEQDDKAREEARKIIKDCIF